MDNGFCCFNKKFVMESKERNPNVNVLLCHLLDRIKCKYNQNLPCKSGEQVPHLIKVGEVPHLVKVGGGSTPCKSGGRFHTL